MDSRIRAVVDQAATIDDPTRRTTTAVELADQLEQAARELRGIRDAGIRELRAAGRTMPQIAEDTGVNLHTVKVVLR